MIRYRVDCSNGAAVRYATSLKYAIHAAREILGARRLYRGAEYIIDRPANDPAFKNEREGCFAQDLWLKRRNATTENGGRADAVVSWGFVNRRSKTVTSASITGSMAVIRASAGHPHFRTKITSELIDGKRFVTCDRAPGDKRARYTIWEVGMDGTVSQVSGFQQFKSRRTALRHVLMAWPIQTEGRQG